jgi:uncharacterized protein
VDHSVTQLLKGLRNGWWKTEQRGGSGNFAQDRERAAEAGRKGGQQSSGNLAHDRERASDAGQNGGHSQSWWTPPVINRPRNPTTGPEDGRTLLPISICGDSTPRQSATPAELQKPHIAGRRPVMGHRRAEIITPLAAGILGAFWLHPSASAACCERVKGVI